MAERWPRWAEGRWCGECGLKLAPDMPMIVWNGHRHTSVSGEVMEAAAVALGVARVAHEDGNEDATWQMLTLMRSAGVSEQAAEMFARAHDPSPNPEKRG